MKAQAKSRSKSESRRSRKLAKRKIKKEIIQDRKEVAANPFKPTRWYELEEYFDPDKIVRLRPQEEHKERLFVLGKIDEVLILQVPEDSPPEVVRDALQTMSDKGVRALAFTDNIKFMKMRMCSPEEEEKLHVIDQDGKGVVSVGEDEKAEKAEAENEVTTDESPEP